MDEELAREIEAALERALEQGTDVFVEPPGPRPEGGCVSCGEVLRLDPLTDMCEDCTVTLYRFYPETRPPR